MDFLSDMNVDERYLLYQELSLIDKVKLRCLSKSFRDDQILARSIREELASRANLSSYIYRGLSLESYFPKRPLDLSEIIAILSVGNRSLPNLDFLLEQLPHILTQISNLDPDNYQDRLIWIIVFRDSERLIAPLTEWTNKELRKYEGEIPHNLFIFIARLLRNYLSSKLSTDKLVDFINILYEQDIVYCYLLSSLVNE